MVHAGLALFKIPPRRTFLKTPKNILVPKNYFLCAKFISRSVILTNCKWKEIYPGREMYCLIMHITPKKKRYILKHGLKQQHFPRQNTLIFATQYPLFLKWVWSIQTTKKNIHLLTWSELRMAKRYWNAMVFLLIAMIPNTQVNPSSGSSTIMPLTPALKSDNKLILLVFQENVANTVRHLVFSVART